MKIPNKNIEKIMNQATSDYICVLIYGTDYGLIIERIEKLIKSFKKNECPEELEIDIKEIDSKDLQKEPRLLFEEAQSFSLLSSKTIIKINNSTDSITKIIKNYLENPDKESFLILQADTLGPSSSIRKLFEEHPIAKVIPCYNDENHNIAILLDSSLKNENISISEEAKTALVERLGLDRLITKTEIEKAILFASPNGKLEYEQIISFVGDQTSINLEKLSDNTLLGDFQNTLSVLSRLEKEDTSSIQIIKNILKQLQNLHRIKISIMNNSNSETVINNFKPPIYFKRKANVIKQTKLWTIQKISKALSILYRAELECKKSSLLQKTLVRQVILSLCLIASTNIN